MQSPNSRRRLVIILGVFVALVIVGLVAALHGPSKKPAVNGSSGSHIDQFSHETVSNPQGKTPEKYGVNADLPVYLGFDKLLDYGLGSDQLKNIETAFYNYSKSLKQPLGMVSVDVDHISSQHDPTNPNSNFVVSFKVQFDEKNTYQTRVEYSGLYDVRLFILSLDGSQVYDSGTLYSEQQSD